MNNSAFENLKAAERIVKKGYRRWRNKLSPNELLGYNLFAELVSTVHAPERFLLSSKVLEANTKAETKYVTKVAFKNHLENLEFDICSAFNGKKLLVRRTVMCLFTLHPRLKDCLRSQCMFLIISS